VKMGVMLPAMMSVELNEMAMRGVEALGMDSVWLPDHLLGPFHPDLWSAVPASGVLGDPDSYLDPFCVAAVLGRETGLAIGTCVTDGTRRRSADLVRTALTLQHSGKGEFILGIGSGEAESLLPFGYSFDRPVALLEQSLREMRSLFDTGKMPGGGVGRSGLAARDGGIPPQIWVAAHGRRSLALTGRYADGWLPTRTTPQEWEQQLAAINEAADAAGRGAPIAGLFPLVMLAESRDAAAAVFERNPVTKMLLLSAPASLWSQYGLQHPCGPDCRGFPDMIPHVLDPTALRASLEQVPREMVEAFFMTGNASELAEQIRPYQQRGLDYLVIGDITGLTHDAATVAALMPELGKLKSLLHQTRAAATTPN
jgi:phthiodiolone/phenolphthiodiolone dimycocerosates ketoreductase